MGRRQGWRRRYILQLTRYIYSKEDMISKRQERELFSSAENREMHSACVRHETALLYIRLVYNYFRCQSFTCCLLEPCHVAARQAAASRPWKRRALMPEGSKAVESAALEAARSSSRGSGQAPRGPASRPESTELARAARRALRGRRSRARHCQHVALTMRFMLASSSPSDGLKRCALWYTMMAG